MNPKLLLHLITNRKMIVLLALILGITGPCYAGNNFASHQCHWLFPQNRMPLITKDTNVGSLFFGEDWERIKFAYDLSGQDRHTLPALFHPINKWKFKERADIGQQAFVGGPTFEFFEQVNHQGTSVPIRHSSDREEWHLHYTVRVQIRYTVNGDMYFAVEVQPGADASLRNPMEQRRNLSLRYIAFLNTLYRISDYGHLWTGWPVPGFAAEISEASKLRVFINVSEARRRSERHFIDGVSHILRLLGVSGNLRYGQPQTDFSAPISDVTRGPYFTMANAAQSPEPVQRVYAGTAGVIPWARMGFENRRVQ